jgi:hypothetical protein
MRRPQGMHEPGSRLAVLAVAGAVLGGLTACGSGGAASSPVAPAAASGAARASGPAGTLGAGPAGAAVGGPAKGGSGGGGGAVPVASTAGVATASPAAPAGVAPAGSRPAAGALPVRPSSGAPAPYGRGVHFDTPAQAMRFLAAAYNRNDLAALQKVTTPGARQALGDMHREAVNLRLATCQSIGNGTYLCTFRHDYPRSVPKSRRDPQGGEAEIVVAPAHAPGWYASRLAGCG